MRFITPDPLVGRPSNSQEFNRYSYANNSPFHFVDTTGFQDALPGDPADPPPPSSPSVPGENGGDAGSGTDPLSNGFGADAPAGNTVVDDQLPTVGDAIAASNASTGKQTLDLTGNYLFRPDQHNTDTSKAYLVMLVAAAVGPALEFFEGIWATLSTWAVLHPGTVEVATAIAAAQGGTMIEGAAPERAAEEAASEAFHFGFSKNMSSIMDEGLRLGENGKGAFATLDGTLSPLQAQVDLALSPNRGLPDALLRIDLDGLRSAGYEIPDVTQVGRSFNMPGGGTEMQFPYSVPPNFLTPVIEVTW
jgi:hypothetical protein